MEEENLDDYQEQEHLHDPEDDKELSSKGDFPYNEVSEMSDVTEESYPDGVEMLREGAKDLENYDRLMEQTRKRLNIIDDGNNCFIYFHN